MAPLNHIFRANARFAEHFSGTAIAASPARKITVLTCMDTRIDDLQAFGLEVGDAHILRNAGGRVTDDVIRSLILSTDELGSRHVAVIHHTRCGLATGSNEAIRARIEAARPVNLQAVDFDPFDDVEASVREDLARLRDCSLLRSDLEFAGFVYDVASGRLSRVEPVAESA